MKKLTHLEQLDDRLRMMPKPTLDKNRELQIKRTIMNTRTTKITPKKKRNIKGITATIGAIAAAFLFVILIYGNVGQSPQTSTIPFSSFVDEDITKIVGITENISYSSEDREIIDSFYDTVGSLEFTELNSDRDRFSSVEGLELYNQEGELLQTLHFEETGLVYIGNNLYEFDASKWHEFRDVFFTNEHLAVEDLEDEEKTEEQPDETENVQELFDSELAKAPSERNWDNIYEFIQDGANPDKALLIAAKENLESIVTELLELGANSNAVDGYKDTPLTLTTSTAVAKLLIDSGAELEHRNARDHSALVNAVYGHQTEMAKLLLESGANPNTTITTSSDFTVLWMAGKYNLMPIGDLLIQHGATLIDGYDLESWMASEVPYLKDMLDENFLSYASIGRLPNILTVQLPADPSVFENQYGEKFESFEVDGGTADVYGDHIFIKPNDSDMYLSYRFELNPGDHVTVADVENVLGSPKSTYMNENKDRVIMSYMLEHYDLQLIYDGTITYPKDEANIIALELHYKKPGVMEPANEVLDILANGDMNELATYVHPEKGVLFAPFLQLTSTPMYEQHEPITFHANEIPTLLQDEEVYHWGDHAASGLPIEMTPAEYFDSYVYAKQEPDAIYVNQQYLSGPEFFTDNVRGMFPDAHMVQYSFDETVEGEELSWMQLTLIFEEYDGEWKLVGIMHNAWTP
ncbi:ankyrin repeat domain-containing protein [Paucisalibacillus globulus]|uniref:ankyrin repeat domain-containing protein n=1 Tax=Paucisalibacillus globulus TaxID=351095 RepID=UPI0004028A1C|nr:ankyrin repeat domain-containing protein [Paucisalibacillus globulus]